MGPGQDDAGGQPKAASSFAPIPVTIEVKPWLAVVENNNGNRMHLKVLNVMEYKASTKTAASEVGCMTSLFTVLFWTVLRAQVCAGS